MMDYATSTDELISMSVKKAQDAGLVQNGDLVVVTAGVPVGVSGTTNMIKVHMVGDSLLAGVGIGQHNAKGEVCVCRNATEAAKKFKPGQILVVPFTTNDSLPFTTPLWTTCGAVPASSPRRPVPTAIPLLSV